MDDRPLPSCGTDHTMAALIGVSAVFTSLGRVFICLDSHFRVVHTSPLLPGLVGEEVNRALPGRPVSQFLGEELFGEAGTMREALLRSEKREGWRALVRKQDGGSLLLSVTAAPFIADASGVCDPRVAYIVVLRPAEDEQTSGGPTLFSGMIARSAAMSQIFKLIENLQSSDATVLITGESGTGKEMVARAIHEHSPRREGPFVAVSCAGLPGELLESELFGHVRGAFTGAVRDRIGRFELASQGTLFLDEIGDLPLPLQVKLLRVLQERTFERVGESHSRKTNARIIAATNVDLKRAAMTGRFRDDLYYRLRVVPIDIAPLRDRREDVEPLARTLLARVAARHGRELRFSPDAMRALLRYSWPGNVRELENALEYAIAVSKGQTLHIEDLPAEVISAETPRREPVESREAEDLLRALEEHHWRRDDAAQALGMSRTTLWRKMREHRLAR